MTVSELETEVWTLLDDDGTYYPEPAVRSALNEAQRFFSLLTLSLESTGTLQLLPNTQFYHARYTFPDWLVGRRILNSDGLRLRPGRLSDLDALNAQWQAWPGDPARYALAGLDFLAIAPQPAGDDYLSVTYARVPALLFNQADQPEIPQVSHFALANYAAYALRQVEGGQEFSKFLGYFNDFLDEAERMQQLVKAKNLDARYERPPFELAAMDRSRLLAWRPQL